MTGELIEEYTICSKDVLNELLMKYLGEIPCNGADSFSPVPVVVERKEIARMEKLCQVLNKALASVVNAYFNNESIRSIYNFDEDLNRILGMAKAQPYEVGMYRPDFLQAEDGGIKICEIGARYPINGWMISYYLNVITKENETIDLHHRKLFLLNKISLKLFSIGLIVGSPLCWYMKKKKAPRYFTY